MKKDNDLILGGFEQKWVYKKLHEKKKKNDMIPEWAHWVYFTEVFHLVLIDLEIVLTFNNIK